MMQETQNTVSDLGFDWHSTAVRAEEIRTEHQNAVDQIETTHTDIESERVGAENLIAAARLLKASGVELSTDEVKAQVGARTEEKITEIEKTRENADKFRKAALWDASQHYGQHEEEYRVAAVNDAAAKGVTIESKIDGKPVMPLELAIKVANEEGKEIVYGGEKYSPPPPPIKFRS